jgi:hypothetical protein
MARGGLDRKTNWLGDDDLIEFTIKSPQATMEREISCPQDGRYRV